MSKWLRRGFGQNSGISTEHSHHLQQQAHPPTTEFPSPPRNDMPSSSAAVAAYQDPIGYGAPSPVAMDVDVGNHASRSKYASYQPPNQQHRVRDDGGSQRSRRSSSRDERRSRSFRQGATSAPQAPPPQHQYSPAAPPPPSMAQSQQTPMRMNLGSSTPPDAVQPSFPPPAVTADSPPPTEAVQRRPAYLLHRDLVIGKGSYGQVCIASRGEPEGHTSAGRSGKRKKFACKCVMLRNDPKYIAKLQEEVNVLRELRGHDNVIRLYDVFCVDNELFIITELGRGGDLFHLLTTHPKHGVTEAYAGT